MPELFEKTRLGNLLPLSVHLQEAVQQEIQMVISPLVHSHLPDSVQLVPKDLLVFRKLLLELDFDQVFYYQQKHIGYHQVTLEQLLSLPDLHYHHQSGYDEGIVVVYLQVLFYVSGVLYHPLAHSLERVDCVHVYLQRGIRRSFVHELFPDEFYYLQVVIEHLD